MWVSTLKATTIAAIVIMVTIDAASAIPNADGWWLRGGVTVSGTTVLGTAYRGGEYDEGTFWSFDTDTETFNKLHDFHSTHGARPGGGLVLSNATVFGTTGCCGGGTVWSFDTTDGAFAKLYQFDGSVDGESPTGDIALSGTTLYGVTQSGGEGEGTAWSFDTSTMTFTNLHEFFEDADGLRPQGGVAVSGTTVFGTASDGGRYGDGTIWSIDTNSDTFTNLHDFDSTHDGKTPLGNVALSGAKIFGTTRSGARGEGMIWSFDTNTNTFANLHSFSHPTDGGNPASGGLTMAGATLYGTTWEGGQHSYGTLWSFDTNTETFNTLHDFNMIDGIYSLGNVAVSDMTVFGTSHNGGKYDKGTLWSFDVSTGMFTKLRDFGSPPGDFNSNSILDVADIDMLSSEVRLGSEDLIFNLNDDFTVDLADVQFWVEDLKKTFFGDANLDGEFNSTDLVEVFRAGQYEDNTALNSTWATGDWNADAEFESGDLVFAFAGSGYGFGPRPAAIPEPSPTVLVLTGALVLMRRRVAIASWSRHGRLRAFSAHGLAIRILRADV